MGQKRHLDVQILSALPVKRRPPFFCRSFSHPSTNQRPLPSPMKTVQFIWHEKGGSYAIKVGVRMP